MTVDKIEDKQGKQGEQITKAQFDELLNAVNALKEENKVLKAHADETIQEKRAMKQKHDEEKANLDKQLEDKVNRTKDENEQLIKQYKEQNAQLLQNVEDMKQKELNSKLDNKALELAQKLAAKHPEKAALLAKEFKKRIKLDEDGSIKVLDDQGKLTISPVDQLVTEYSTKYAFLCDGVDSTGGGSHSSGVGAQSKKLSEMSESEQVELYKTDLSKYRELEKLG